MAGKIIRPDDNEEFYTDERCYILESSNSSFDRDVSIARARVEPGTTTCWHRLKRSTERYRIVSGKGSVEVGDEPAQVVVSGDVVIIPPMCKQRIENIGKDDLVFLVICTPRFHVEDYEDLEQ